MDLTRYWPYPDESGAPAFTRALLEVGGKAEMYWVRPTRGRWYDPLSPGEGWSSVWDTLIAGLGIPEGHVGAIGLAANDPRLQALLTLQLMMGTSLLSDATVLPSHGQHLWFFEHHDVLWGEFADMDTMQRHIAGLAIAGFPLPDEPPDPTFKPQPWQC